MAPDLSLPSLENDQPLRGIKVLELASVLAGPLVGTFLAELGAEVIKVEHPSNGDVTRAWRSQGEDQNGPSAYYAAANGPKRVIRQDLTLPEGQQWLQSELENTDILLQNFKTSSLGRLRLDPDKLAKQHPRLIHIHLKGFMDDVNRGGYDIVVQAETGFLAMNGTAESAPFRMPVALMDVLAAHQMRSAVLLALYQREKDGLGAYAEAWLDASGFSALANRATEHLVAGQSPAPLGPLHPQIAPYGEAFACGCGETLVTAVGNDAQFARLCQLLELTGVHQDPQFASNPQRVKNRVALFAALEPAFAKKSAADIMEQALLLGVPLGQLKSVEEALTSPTGRAMTSHFQLDGHPVKHVRQVAFQVHRTGSRTT